MRISSARVAKMNGNESMSGELYGIEPHNAFRHPTQLISTNYSALPFIDSKAGTAFPYLGYGL
jgi:hypothetical protein